MVSAQLHDKMSLDEFPFKSKSKFLETDTNMEGTLG